MTDHAPPPHLDDEDLSALLDGIDVERAAAHVTTCPACAARRDALVSARDALRDATVAPLAGDVLDRLVLGALDAPGEVLAPVAPVAGVATLERARTRRFTSPPPAWLLGAVASIAVLAGAAGLLRAGDGGDRLARDATRSAAGSATGRAGPETAAAVDPELVTADLGDIAGAAALAAALEAPVAQDLSASATAAAGGGGAAAEAAPAAPTTMLAPTSGDAASATASGSATGGTRAQCRREAEQAGGGRLGPLQATATLRWEGRPAEVLVFALAEPAGGFTRQALVLARPGCELLADPRL